MVYWALRGYDASIPTNTELFGFGVGDEHVVSVLKVPQVQQTTSGASETCIGCHTATPDGAFVGFTGNYPVGQRARVGRVGRDRRDAAVPRQRRREHADPGLSRHHHLLGRALGRGRPHRDHVAEHAAGRSRPPT